MERRFSRRSHLNDETTICTKDGTFAAILENISMGGLFLRTNRLVEIGDMIEVNIPLPPQLGNREILVTCIAIRIEGTGVALGFIELDEDTQRALLFLTDGGQA